MRIVCDRCKKEMVSFDCRDNWTHIETSEKGYGKLGDYYLCPECSHAFYDFLDNKAGEFDYNFNVPIWKCMLPRKIKRAIYKTIQKGR